MKKTILGIFENRNDVEAAVDKLKAEGFDPKDISIVMKDKGEQRDVENSTGTDVAGGALSGATTGAVVGGITGLLAGTVVPALGGLLIGGPIGAALGLTGAAATTVSGAATGAVAGGLLGALMGLGLPKEDAEHYEKRVTEGAILLAVPAGEGDARTVTSIFDEYNASDVKSISAGADRKTDYSDEVDAREHERHQRDSGQQYVHVGAKGGKSKSEHKIEHKGRGWFGDSKGHSKAAKGEDVPGRG